MVSECSYVGCAGTFQSKDGLTYAKYLFKDNSNGRVTSVVSEDISANFKRDVPYFIESYKSQNGWVSRLLNVC